MSNDKLEAEITVHLKNSIDYSYKGETETATFVILIAPTSRHIKHIVRIKNIFYKSIAGLDTSNSEGIEVDEDENEDEEKGPMNAMALMNMLYMSKDFEPDCFIDYGTELMKSGVVKLEGQQKLTDPLISKMSPGDIENILGEYLANFIVRSQ